jgi:hypothetical protein
MVLSGRAADGRPTRKATDICISCASWNLNKVLGFRMTASLGIRLGGTNSNPIPRRRRSDEFRLGARRRARLLMSCWCSSNKDSATTARTPPGRRSLAMVANRWTASISRCIIDRDGSTMPVSHKTARDDPFYMCKDLRIRHAQDRNLVGYDLRPILGPRYFQ